MDDIKAAARRLLGIGELFAKFSRNKKYSDDLVLVATWALGASEREERLRAALEEVHRYALCIVGASEAYGETESAHLWGEVAAIAETALWPRTAVALSAVPPHDAELKGRSYCPPSCKAQHR